MIIHHVPRKTGQASSFKKLIHYLTAPQGKSERVGRKQISNCISNEVSWAIEEVRATQAKNTRAKGDKTYHLVISFAPGEEPNDEMLEKIEERVVDSIGLLGHQRISIAHHDTDNLHIHVAINKVHPKTFNMVEPYRAYKKFAEVAEKLEVEFNLIRTNHTPKYHLSENLAKNMEHHSGIESLNSWIKRHCLAVLNHSKTWDDVHLVLAEHGLIIKRQGNGFIFCSQKGVRVKASSVSRDLSKSKLEQRLGPFNENQLTVEKLKFSYKRSPTCQGGSVELYERYESERAKNSHMISQELKRLSLKKKQLFDKAKQKSKLKRQAIKLMSGSRQSKKIMHALISRQYKKEAQKITKQCAIEREDIIKRNPNLSWLDWLQQQALDGNEQALSILRLRSETDLNKKNPQNIHTDNLNSVTKEGTLLYELGNKTVRDDGKNIKVPKGLSPEELKQALIIAKEQYGNCLKITGSETFKKAVARIAVKNDIDITFSEKDLEKYRLTLTSDKEKIDDGQFINRDSRRAGGSNGTHGDRAGERRGVRVPRGSASSSKPHPNRFRISAPAQGQDSVRELPERHVAKLTGRCEVLLQDNAHDELEHKGAKPNNKVRRSVFGLRLGRKLKKNKLD